MVKRRNYYKQPIRIQSCLPKNFSVSSPYHPDNLASHRPTVSPTPLHPSSVSALRYRFQCSPCDSKQPRRYRNQCSPCDSKQPRRYRFQCSPCHSKQPRRYRFQCSPCDSQDVFLIHVKDAVHVLNISSMRSAHVRMHR